MRFNAEVEKAATVGVLQVRSTIVQQALCLFLLGFNLSLCVLQVLYLLNQLQNKPICEETEAKQKDDESSRERELLQRLRMQVGICWQHKALLFSVFSRLSLIVVYRKRSWKNYRN